MESKHIIQTVPLLKIIIIYLLYHALKNKMRVTIRLAYVSLVVYQCERKILGDQHQAVASLIGCIS